MRNTIKKAKMIEIHFFILQLYNKNKQLNLNVLNVQFSIFFPQFNKFGLFFL